MFSDKSLFLRFSISACLVGLALGKYISFIFLPYYLIYSYVFFLRSSSILRSCSAPSKPPGYFSLVRIRSPLAASGSAEFLTAAKVGSWLAFSRSFWRADLSSFFCFSRASSRDCSYFMACSASSVLVTALLKLRSSSRRFFLFSRVSFYSCWSKSCLSFSYRRALRCD